MPLFPTNLADLKGLNPLNLFSSEPEQPALTTPKTSVAGSSSQAVAGPGPSSAAAVTKRPTLGAPINGNSTSPPRPCLKQSSPSPTSSISSESIPGRRKPSSVMIADPEVSSVSGEGEKDNNEQRRTGARKKQRPLSTGSLIEGADGDGKTRKKKKPLDTYIIVKPPPNTSKNPLNLQIQLVVKPSRRGRTRSASAFSTNSSSTMNTNDGASIAASMSPGRQSVDLPDETASSESNEPVTPASTTSQKAFLETPATDVAGLKRSTSVKSSISTTTTSTSSGSLSTGKRIEPMFNLAVHNVMQPTVVTDAATDVKVAKFLKRTLDINGVGVLEPAEVWLNNVDHAPLLPTTSRLSDDGHATARPARPLSVVSAAPLSPTLAPIDDGRSARNSTDLKGFKFENLRLHKEGGEGRTRKFFGKVFKKGHNDELVVPTAIKTSPSPSFSGASAEPPSPALLAVDKANTLHPNAAVRASVSDITHASIGHATFGTSPMVMARRQSGAIVMADGAVTGLTAAPTEPAQLKPEIAEQAQALPLVPSSRPVGYTWTVKKWARKNAEGWAAHIVAAAAAGLEMVGNGSHDGNSDEVVFEWVKLRVPSNAIGSEIMRRYSNSGVISSAGKNTTRSRSKSKVESLASTVNPGNVDSSAATATPGVGAGVDNLSGSKLQIPRRSASPLPPSRPGSAPSSAFSSPRLDARPEPVRRLSCGYGVSPSASPSRRASPTRRVSNTSLDVDKLSLADRDLSAEEELNTDDGGGEDSDPEDSETPWTCSVWVKKTGQRQLLGTLTPAPHHPKVIGVLKIPMGLDSIALTDVKQDVESIKNVRNANEKIKALKEGVAMSEENLKDVVCVTAMWLVAREEFGGLGRKKGLR